MRRERLLSLGGGLLGLLLLAGCYGKQLIREPINVDETRQEVGALRADITELQERANALEQKLESHDADQSSLRATMQMQLEEIQEQLRTLSIQTQEMMNLMADLSVGRSRQPAAPDLPEELAAPRQAPAWERPAPGYELPPEGPEDAEEADPEAARAESPPPLEPVDDRPADASGPSGPSGSPGSPGQAAEPDARQLYDAAYLDLTRGNYQLALMEFREYLERYSDTDLADNAQYWIGEVYYAQSQYDQAIEEFLKVVDRYPQADKVPAAYLKTAYSFRRLGDLPTARRYLRLIMDRYPDSEESRLARQSLAEFR